MVSELSGHEMDFEGAFAVGSTVGFYWQVPMRHKAWVRHGTGPPLLVIC